MIEELVSEYIRLRHQGSSAKSILQGFRTQIESLSADQRAELVARVRAWEAETHAARTPEPESSASKPPFSLTPPNPRPLAARLKRLGQADETSAADFPEPPLESFLRQPEPEAEQPPVVSADEETDRMPPAPEIQLTCPNCGKTNESADVFCAHCGYFLQTSKSHYQTTKFETTDQLLPADDYFGPESSLVLRLRDTDQVYTIRPQEFRHELVVGRGDGGTMKPDIDLAIHNASDKGVSRLHLSLRFNVKHNTLSASDMNSANGSFINGQRLHPQEIRVLHHGDELRLGRMKFLVEFQHGR
jgi:hypothetical protein